MKYKFEELKVWKVSLILGDHIYSIAEELPEIEKFNLRSQIVRASTSVSLNIAEGSTSQSNKEQVRFIKYAIRSLIELIACLRIMERRGYHESPGLNNEIEQTAHNLFIKLQAFKNSIE